MLPASLLIVVAGALDGTAQGLMWVGRAGGRLRRRSSRAAPRAGASWPATSPSATAWSSSSRWASRSSRSASARQGLGLDAGIIVGALLGVAVAAALWWAYFDFVALVAAARAARGRAGDEQVRIARDSYTYLHLPMVAGIVLFALGTKKTLAHVGDELEAVPAVALCGGVALYLVALSALKRRNIGSFNWPRLVAAVLLAVLAPVATAMPALVALALVAVLAVGLIAYEMVRYAETRDRVRHG